MKAVINPILDNLDRGYVLLDSLTNEQFVANHIGPYNSTVGQHFRHILDIFSCIFNGLDERKVDLTARERNELAESNIGVARNYLDTIYEKLKSIQDLDPNIPVKVTDDLGLGRVDVNYTLGSALCQAHSHAIHHFASLGYMLHQLDVKIPDTRFGYNPTTPESA
ncbi:MAG TPA: DinB family protein [Saprospiraceae bacterium]|nr:DinB family protein [Saprospiraceae bacterium]